jgi:hypothetical protein
VIHSGSRACATTLRVIDPNGELPTTMPRNSTDEISRFKAYGSKHSHLTGRI